MELSLGSIILTYYVAIGALGALVGCIIGEIRLRKQAKLRGYTNTTAMLLADRRRNRLEKQARKQKTGAHDRAGWWLDKE